MSPRSEPLLGCATTGELLDELDARNRVGQGNVHPTHQDRASEHIRKLRLSFSIRNPGLEYKTVDQ